MSTLPKELRDRAWLLRTVYESDSKLLTRAADRIDELEAALEKAYRPAPGDRLPHHDDPYRENVWAERFAVQARQIDVLRADLASAQASARNAMQMSREEMRRGEAERSRVGGKDETCPDDRCERNGGSHPHPPEPAKSASGAPERVTLYADDAGDLSMLPTATEDSTYDRHVDYLRADVAAAEVARLEEVHSEQFDQLLEQFDARGHHLAAVEGDLAAARQQITQARAEGAEEERKACVAIADRWAADSVTACEIRDAIAARKPEAK